MNANEEVRQLIVHPAAWDGLVAWFASRRIDVVQIPSEPDDLPTFILSPRDLGPHDDGPIERRL